MFGFGKNLREGDFPARDTSRKRALGAQNYFNAYFAECGIYFF